MLRHSQSATQSSLWTMPGMFCGSEQEYLNNLEDIEYIQCHNYTEIWNHHQPAGSQHLIPLWIFLINTWPGVKMNCTDHRPGSRQDLYSRLFICQIWWWSLGATLFSPLIGYLDLNIGLWLVRTAYSWPPGPIILTSQFPALMGQKMIIKLASDQWSLEA